MTKNSLYRICIVILLFAGNNKYCNAQSIENSYQTRTELKLNYKLSDKWKIIATPELRLDDSFSIDKYILELRTVYSPVKNLSLGAAYRFVANKRQTKDTEYLQRYAFDAAYKYKIDRWTPKVRLRYTNYSEDDTKGEFLRYKAALAYNIKKCKFSPFVGAELFHELNNQEFLKMRYSLGGDYKLNKKNAITLAYKLDYFMQEFLNKHIVYVGYKYKF